MNFQILRLFQDSIDRSTFQLKNLQGGNSVENSNDDTCVIIAEFIGE